MGYFVGFLDGLNVGDVTGASEGADVVGLMTGDAVRQLRISVPTIPVFLL